MRNRDGSRNGFALRKQRIAKSARQMIATTRLASVPEDSHPQSLPLTMARTSAAMPPLTRIAAIGLGLGTSWPGTSGNFQQPTIIASRPIGTLTMKIQRQLTVTRRPPATGPNAAASPPSAVQTLTAWVRRSGGNDASNKPIEVGVIKAAPAACTNRKMTNVVTLLAAPHAADATVKRPTPSRKLMFRRYRSASRPKKTRSAAYAIA